MLARYSIRTKLFLIVFLMTGVVAGIGSFGWYTTWQGNQAMAVVFEDQVRPVSALNDILDALMLAGDAVRQLEHRSISLREARSRIGRANDRIIMALKRYHKAGGDPAGLPVNHAEQEPRRPDTASPGGALEPALAGTMPLFDELLSLESDDRDAALGIGTELQEAADRTREPIQQLIAAKTELVDRSYRLARGAYRKSIRLSLGFATIGILVAVLFCLNIARDITASIRQVDGRIEELVGAEADLTRRIPITTSDELGTLASNFNRLMGNLEDLVRQAKTSGILVTSSSTHIAAETRQLEATVTQQNAATNEVVASAREISATSQELLETMTSVAGLSEEMVVSASVGQESLLEMEQTMATIDGAARMVSEKLAVINDKAANISAVVTTINKVAEQTNLLSLNAAIESEKAGEYGKGFAVVAREIRRLADQTAVATLGIERMVKEMKGAVAAGVMSMDKFSEQVRHAVSTVSEVSSQLGDIIEQVTTLNPQFETVVTGMRVQADGARQISTVILQVGQAAEQTERSLQETSEAISQLNQAARGLQEEFSRFTVA